MNYQDLVSSMLWLFIVSVLPSSAMFIKPEVEALEVLGSGESFGWLVFPEPCLAREKWKPSPHWLLISSWLMMSSPSQTRPLGGWRADLQCPSLWTLEIGSQEDSQGLGATLASNLPLKVTLVYSSAHQPLLGVLITFTPLSRDAGESPFPGRAPWLWKRKATNFWLLGQGSIS